ncbi:MAG: 16S rRNA (adenine(1518)-N(6)/adenine(1519)-N(6))-dimethyltransferase RsmA, partial [Actinobacteria bacterium]|nr:16S rRNA (adenine(1518)-N(6)/adenine(1519)-N(6))-dimethyltransferase RsmA [Actinomycetota bacterium]
MQVTPSVASDLLERYNLRAGRKHGQHFLVDPNTVRRIVRLADISPDETILEIGPGLGSLTVALAEAAARVVAVEIDTEVAEALREVIASLDNVELVIADAMKVDIDTSCRLVANLPYNVATPLIIRVLDDIDAVSGGLVMVQRELGERWTASPGTKAYGSVSVHVAYHASARIVGEVPRTVFMPQPKVSSVLVAFERRELPPVDVADERAFLAFVRRAFTHRRKT